MVRLPPGFHPQGARRASSKFSWRPGWAGTGQQPISRVPVGRYSSRISSVPLTGGQAQGLIPGYPTAAGTIDAPPPFTDVTSVVTVVQGGTYTVSWAVSLAGTTSASDANNFVLSVNEGETLFGSLNAGTPGTYQQTPQVLTLNAGDTLSVGSRGNSGTAGSVYSAAIPGQSQPLTLQVGPQALGTTWYPVSVTLSTATGALDTSTALVYLGPAATPATLQATVYSGNGTAALAIPAMSPGQTVIVTWQNGHPGDIAALNITGTMDALSTV